MGALIAFIGPMFLTLCARLATSGFLRFFTRLFLFGSVEYFAQALMGNGASIMNVVLHPNQMYQETVGSVFGNTAVVGWGPYILWLTGLLDCMRIFIEATVSWFLVKNMSGIGGKK